MRICSSVKALNAYIPGEQPKSKRVIKLNTNENPYPPSPKCAEVLKAFDLDLLRRYPDPNFLKLRTEIAKQTGAKVEQIFVGNGSDEILTLAARAFVEDSEAIGSLDPSYSLYQTLADIRHVPWVGGLPTTKAVSLFLWTNPNAPTGEFVDPQTIAAFAKSFPGVVLIDEAYADFARANCMHLATAKDNQNILVMRTFSKSYSLAGLRVGYCVGPADLIEALYKVKDSYNVDAVAQAVALAALKDKAYHKRTVRQVIQTRQAFTQALLQLGWDVIPSETNFVFAKPPAPLTAQTVFDTLKQHNIYVRYFPGAKTGERLRITIGTDAQMDTCLKKLKEIH